MSEPAVSDAPVDPLTAGPAGPQAKAVLIIDDDRMLGRLAAHAVGKIGGFRAILATSAQEGLDLAERELPDLVLLDLWLGEQHGAEVLASLRSRPATAGLLVAMLSGEADPAVLSRCHALGVAGVIKKPFEPRALAERVRGLLEGKGAADEREGSDGR